MSNPAQTFANIQGWFNADTYALADGAAVSGAWVDGAGLGNATPSGTLTFKLAGLRGRPAIQFGGGSFSIADRAALRFTSSAYIAAVLAPTANDNKTICCKGDTAGSPDYLFSIGRNSDRGIGLFDGTAWRDGSAGVFGTNTPIFVELVWNGSTDSFYANGVAKGTPGGANWQTSTQALRIGQQGSTAVNVFDGLLAELVICGSVTASERYAHSLYVRDRFFRDKVIV